MLQVPVRNFEIPPVSQKLHTSHPRAAITQARRIQKNFDISAYQGRTEVQGITIDSAISKDLDDGVWVKELPNGKWYLVQVTIASPTELIETNSPIDKEAFNRATSVYFWENYAHHMLPDSISTDISSLNHQTKRLSLTLEIEFDSDFNIRRKDVFRSIFANEYRFTPEEFTRGINQESSSYHDTFSVMHKVAQKLFTQRENGLRVKDFDDADRRITIWEKIPWMSNRHISSFVIQELMILANIEVAKFMISEQINGVFRNHMPEYADGRDLPRILERAEYRGEMAFHLWLGLSEYCHFTSPIRRLADTIVHRQVIQHILWLTEVYSKEDIAEICHYINLQVSALVNHQKDELLDMRGKRVIRRAKKSGEKSPILQHIKTRNWNGLRIPQSVRAEILKQIEETGVEDWMIYSFLFGPEEEIREAIIPIISKDTKVQKYLNVIQSTWKVSINENLEIVDKDSINFTLRVTTEESEKTFEDVHKMKKWVAKLYDVWVRMIKGFKMKQIRRYDIHNPSSRLKHSLRKQALAFILEECRKTTTKKAA